MARIEDGFGDSWIDCPVCGRTLHVEFSVGSAAEQPDPGEHRVDLRVERVTGCPHVDGPNGGGETWPGAAWRFFHEQAA